MYKLEILNNERQWITLESDLTWSEALYWRKRIMQLGGTPYIARV